MSFLPATLQTTFSAMFDSYAMADQMLCLQEPDESTAIKFQLEPTPFEIVSSRIKRTIDMGVAAYHTKRIQDSMQGVYRSLLGKGARVLSSAGVSVMSLFEGHNFSTVSSHIFQQTSEEVLQIGLERVIQDVVINDPSNTLFYVSEDHSEIVYNRRIGGDAPDVRFVMTRDEVKKIGVLEAIKMFQQLDGFVSHNKKYVIRMKNYAKIEFGNLYLEPEPKTGVIIFYFQLNNHGTKKTQTVMSRVRVGWESCDEVYDSRYHQGHIDVRQEIRAVSIKEKIHSLNAVIGQLEAEYIMPQQSSQRYQCNNVTQLQIRACDRNDGVEILMTVEGNPSVVAFWSQDDLIDDYQGVVAALLDKMEKILGLWERAETNMTMQMVHTVLGGEDIDPQIRER